MPRPWDCDGDDCDYDERGIWRHYKGCTSRPSLPEDVARSTAMEDGYAPRGASQIRHPAFTSTRKYLAEHPLPTQRTAGGEAA